ncbi:hypothetical protein RB653_003878 [Dictyostelium firmibasis]|uniref:nitric oxide dioxygenase n=1 Tax=Dictyostelium firmibasis TaxID=79012 RepID=A0AAN7U5E6_9MYCE
MSLSQKSIQIIKSTVPVLEVHGVTITTTFYRNMFKANPQLLNIFNHSNQREGKQQNALANTVLQAAIHIDKLNELNLAPIFHKHVALGVLPEHYPIVGSNLLGAIKEVLKDAATEDILGAWGEAYGVIANAFIDAEAALYKVTEEQIGGWRDTREFIVDKKVDESSNITSFYFKPVDGKSIATYIPGQYITIKVPLTLESGEQRTHIRHYSLSDTPSEQYYRISVKKENALKESDPNGVVSNHLHANVKVGDKVLLSPPAGDYVVDQLATNPILLISGGVGITPLLSMAKATLVKQPEREITFVHSSKNKQFQPFSNELSQLEKSNKVKVSTIHSDTEGHITKDKLSTLIDPSQIKNSKVYICGPVSFMSTINKQLNELGFPKENISYEIFGPLTNV